MVPEVIYPARNVLTGLNPATPVSRDNHPGQRSGNQSATTDDVARPEAPKTPVRAEILDHGHIIWLEHDLDTRAAIFLRSATCDLAIIFRQFRNWAEDDAPRSHAGVSGFSPDQRETEYLAI
jgi:hypothetical protein